MRQPERTAQEGSVPTRGRRRASLRWGGVALALAASIVWLTSSSLAPAASVGVAPPEPPEAPAAPPDPFAPDPPPPLEPLSTAPVPGPKNIGNFIRDKKAAIALGKAFYWDMQAGSDGVTACASCHFNAGADSRSKNQFSPGLLGGDTVFSAGGPNYQLTEDDFPLRKLKNVNDRHSKVLRNTNDVVSSQGVHNISFGGIVPGSTEDLGTLVPDPVFNVAGTNTRRVEPRQTPTVINAVFFFRNFWDGRAQNDFNGVNPFGLRDKNARVWRFFGPGDLRQVKIRLQDCSLCSQAVGPPLSPFEMSHANRTFKDVGKKLLALRPLGKQVVHFEDSVLGPYALPGGTGLRTSYASMIQRAFKKRWWNSELVLTFDASGTPTLTARPSRALAANEYSQMEVNFSLFWGLAMHSYEATLVSDQTQLDRFLEGKADALNAEEQAGMAIFQGKGRCQNCHSGAELTNASVRNVRDRPLETMVMANNEVATYDNGFYNIGTRQTREDLGVGGTDPFGNPLSMTKLAGVPGRKAVKGNFKAPMLRNLTETAPYFHNGGQATLRQVVEFYNRGGDFHDRNFRNLDPDIQTLDLTSEEKAELVAFLKALTDPRVPRQKAPFDHPQLCIPNGHPGDNVSVTDDGSLKATKMGKASEIFVEIPAVGRHGGPRLPEFLDPLTEGPLTCVQTG